MTELILPNARALVIHQDADQMASAVSQRIAQIITQAQRARGICKIALAGGSTPRRCYLDLCGLPIDWRYVHVYFGDERCLPIGDLERNDTMTTDALLSHVAIPVENIHTIPAELGPEAAAARYSQLIAQIKPLDLVLLGMGEDGHTASLFPGNPALQSIENVVGVFNAPKPPPERVTLGMAILNAAHNKLFLVSGEGKRAALKAIARGEPLPASEVREAVWHIDRKAIPE